MTYSAVAKRLRLPLGFALGIAYLALARPTLPALATGGAVAMAGLLLRAWASGHIVKNEVLATGGPYAHTRNPLYLGSFLIAAGFALAAQWIFAAVVVVLFLGVYYPTMRREVANIAERFPEAYARYAAHVPLFVPRLTPWRGDAGSTTRFSPALYMKHGEWKAAVTYVLAMIWLAYRARAT